MSCPLSHTACGWLCPAQFMQIKLQCFIFLSCHFHVFYFMSPATATTAVVITVTAAHIKMLRTLCMCVCAYKIINVTLINDAHKKCLNGNLSTPKVARCVVPSLFGSPRFIGHRLIWPKTHLPNTSSGYQNTRNNKYSSSNNNKYSSSSKSSSSNLKLQLPPGNAGVGCAKSM